MKKIIFAISALALMIGFSACQKDDTEEPITPENPPTGPVDEHPGRLGGLFSVGADKQVYFSQGNLQYCATTAVWRFAEHQYDFVGDDNIYIFGESSDVVIKRYEDASYVSKDYYDEDENLAKCVDFIISDEMLAVGSKENLQRLYNELLNKDWFMTFPDFKDYCKRKDEALQDYENSIQWGRKMLVNIANAGFFSSDRTIEQYNKDIWHLA